MRRLYPDGGEFAPRGHGRYGARRWSVAKKAVTQTKGPVTQTKGAVTQTKKTVTQAKKEYRIVRYFKEVRAELRKVVWPSRQVTIRLTSIVFGVTVTMSLALGLLDWIFSQIFALII
jgi:preprotein translocase subunit SecE